MNREELVNFVQVLIEENRVEIGQRPRTTPIRWKGIDMTIQEAKLIIQELESQKSELQLSMNKVQTGGEITKLASGGAGLAAMVTGAALMLFPPTAIAGAITLASGVGAAKIGEMVGDGVSDIGTNSNTQAIQQIDEYIDSIKNAIISSI
ncbi:hypothetical protein [Pseudanabaena mucicola]|uniref:Uncharacterized protein n=1 Tax=Pseudanabaena mucicola FACHB-723 TaxID=2692860 RepID=A0ABR7ZWU7_9CYAN|nr:hypothetical protein [Pseudanabaena mucicola]MBD2187985.1 hypothetical protein [Pseudanabaena mucicola FACHB-723]